jgi:Uma2 family endonuclease
MTDHIQHKTMTAAEFRLLPETTTATELIHGEVIVSPSPKRTHQLISSRLFTLLSNLVTDGELLYAPMDIYLDEKNVVQPDLFWISPQSKCQLINDYWHGAPDLVIEILSPSTALLDKSEKFDLYQQFGVCEYWLVETQSEYIEVWCLESDQLKRKGVFGPEQPFISPVLKEQIVNFNDVFAL